jgi:hypothetical protein
MEKGRRERVRGKGEMFQIARRGIELQCLLGSRPMTKIIINNYNIRYMVKLRIKQQDKDR